MTPQDLNPRQKQVLTALVDHYIVRAEPVSSSLLSQSAVLRASSATIRNTLADLEERGFVEQPHTSSGRLPTDRGYRTYVDELMHPEPLAPADRAALDAAIPFPLRGEGSASAEARMAGAAEVLAGRSHLLGLVVPPAAEDQAVFRKVSLIQVAESKVAVVLASGETVRSLLVDTREISIFRLEAIAQRLNEELQGRTVSILNGYIHQKEAEMASGDEKMAFDLVGRSILKLSGEKTGEDIFISGAKNLVNRADFGKISEIQSIFELLESKVTLVHFLRQRQEEEGVHVTIGEERGPDGQLFRSLSLVTAAFSLENGCQGMVGVLGPKRIPYARLVPVVHYAAQCLGRAGEGEHGAS